MPLIVRPLEDADLEAAVALNNAAVPAVPTVDRAAMSELVVLASFAVVAEEVPGRPLGVLLGMDPGLGYDSENYRWFSSRGDDFLYVDRIVVGESARGRGVGQHLYAAAFDRAREQGRARVACEVNLRPENPGSLRFHARLGFERVGEQETKGGSVRVALLEAPVR